MRKDKSKSCEVSVADGSNCEKIVRSFVSFFVVVDANLFLGSRIFFSSSPKSHWRTQRRKEIICLSVIVFILQSEKCFFFLFVVLTFVSLRSIAIISCWYSEQNGKQIQDFDWNAKRRYSCTINSCPKRIQSEWKIASRLFRLFILFTKMKSQQEAKLIFRFQFDFLLPFLRCQCFVYVFARVPEHVLRDRQSVPCIQGRRSWMSARKCAGKFNFCSVAMTRIKWIFKFSATHTHRQTSKSIHFKFRYFLFSFSLRHRRASHPYHRRELKIALTNSRFTSVADIALHFDNFRR